VAKRRQTYNLNRQTKLFDIHKQFMGGLKTIDTDDSLGSVFLRDVDNLSLSEFGFLEKRYGTYISDEFPGIEFETDKPIQGYFEYVDDDGEIHKILFYNGKAYIKNPKAENEEDRNIYKEKTVFITDVSQTDFTYPETNEIENETGWESGDFDPIDPQPPFLPFTGLLKSTSSSSKTIIKFGLLGTETVNFLKSKTSSSKTSIEFEFFGNIGTGPLLAKTSLSKASIEFGVLETIDIDVLKALSSSSKSSIRLGLLATETINLLKSKTSSSKTTIDFGIIQTAERDLKGISTSSKTILGFGILETFERSLEAISSTSKITINFEVPQTFENSLKAISSSSKTTIDFEAIQAPPPIKIVTATFNSNGGTPTYSSISEPAPLYVVSPGSPTRTGYTFVGWSPSLPRNISADTTFVAQWQARTYTVTFNKQGATGGTNSVTATFGSSMPSATAPTRLTGFTFNGYWDATSGGTRYYNNNMTSARTWNKANNATLYARWEACPAAGTPAGSAYCVGFDLYQLKANGDCGTYEDLIEINSASCGYVGPTTQTPSTGTGSVTDSSVTFTVANNDSQQVNITWNIREGSQFGNVVRNGTLTNVGVGNFGLRNITGSSLNSNTIYYLTDVIATASGKLASAAGTVRSLVTDEAPTCPAAGTAIGSPYCVGFNLYQTRADGSCGTYEDLIETNSTSCGYVEQPTTYTFRAKTQTSSSTSGTPVQWEITASGYSQSGQTNLNSSSFTTLRSDVPGSASVYINVPSSFVFNSTTYILQGVLSSRGTVQTISSTEFEVLNVTGDTDLTVNYNVQGGGGGDSGGGGGGGGAPPEEEILF